MLFIVAPYSPRFNISGDTAYISSSSAFNVLSASFALCDTSGSLLSWACFNISLAD